MALLFILLERKEKLVKRSEDLDSKNMQIAEELDLVFGQEESENKQQAKVLIQKKLRSQYEWILEQLKLTEQAILPVLNASRIKRLKSDHIQEDLAQKGGEIQD